MLVGRGQELAALAAVVDAARHGTAGSLVLRGEPGVGKSALVDALVATLVDTAGQATVLRTAGLEVEAPMAYAALHRLLRPVMRLREGLPAPQARALRMAFGEEEGPPVEPFLVGVATLTLLTSAAEERLVLCVVDDAHWLDPSTADALLFCARRIGADRVAMVFAARDATTSRWEAPGLAEMTIGGLAPEASRALLRQQPGEPWAEEVVDRLVAETRGNPLALLELPTELSPRQVRGESPLPPQLHLTHRLEQVFLERSRRLPPPVQSLLLLAAADDSGDIAVLRAAAAELGLGETDLADARGSGLLVADGETVTLRHPLVRSALQQAATREEKGRAHLALAAAYAGLGDPDRAAWQRAAGADGPDADLAEALRLVGSRAEQRGAHGSAMAAYARAAELCADPEPRAALTFSAARSAWACGRAAQAQTLLGSALETAADPGLLADIARLRGHIEVNIGSATLAHRIFVEAAHQVHAVDPLRALETSVLAAIIRSYAADSGTRLAPGEVPTTPAPGDPPRTLCLKRMLLAMTLTADGDWSGAVAALDEATAIGREVDDREVLWNLGNAALQLGDDAAQRSFYTAALSRARAAGAVTAVVYALQRLSFGHYLAGDLVAVRSSAAEALSLSASVDQPALATPSSAWLTLLAAVQGGDDYDDRLHRLEESVSARPLGILTDPVHDLTRWAKGARAAATGDRSAALHHLGRFRLPALARMASVERIDAAVRADEPGLARAWVDELEVFAQATDRPWALAAAAYGRAVTDPDTDADASFTRALSYQGRAGRPLDEARLHLAYGEWLRRAQRRVDARRHLRLALETFQDAHADALSERASQELRASGETARKRDPSTLVKLTPTELRIAELVSSGMSNKDVAAEIWVSPRTVAFHLRNIFAKAGVTSRGELARLDLV